MKGHSIKMNELKLTQTQLFPLFHFECVASNVSEMYFMAHLAYNECFLYHSNLSF